MIELPQSQVALLRHVYQISVANGSELFLMGGTLRDLLLGRPLHDLDLLANGDGLELARAIANSLGGAFVALDAQRRTGRVVLDGHPTLDIAQLRASSLHENLRLHDFTVNAMATPLAPLLTGTTTLPLHDPCGGQADLVTRRLRVCSADSFTDDPGRMLRAVRLTVTLGFTLDPESLSLLRAAVPRIAEVSAERVRDELMLLLDSGGGCWGLRLLDEIGLLTRIFPELEPARNCDQPIVHVLPVLAHSLEAVSAMEWLMGHLGLTHDTAVPYTPQPLAVRKYPELTFSLPSAKRLHDHLAHILIGGHRRAAVLKLATLLHDNAKPQTKAPKEGGGVSFHDHQTIGAEVAGNIARRLRLSRQETNYVATVVREHMRPGQLMQIEDLTIRAVNRFFRDCGDAGPDVLLHSFADHMATRGHLLSLTGWQAHIAWTELLLQQLWEQPQELPALLSGRTLMDTLGLSPGPLVGQLLGAVREAQLAGEITTSDEALDLARRLHNA